MNIFKKDSLAYLFIILGIVILFAAPKGIAQSYRTTGNPGDNTSGEGFTAYRTQETMDYTDANANSKPTTMPADDFSFTILPDYGFSGPVTPETYTVITPGDVSTHEIFIITNEGDADIDTLWAYYVTLESGAVNWTAEVRTGADALVYSLVPGTTSTETITLQDDTDTSTDAEKRYIRVRVSPNVSEAPDGSDISIFLTVESTLKTPSGYYIGGNSLTYGDTIEVTFNFYDVTSAPDLRLTRVATVDAPDKSGYAGNHWDAVPGSIITFTMTYSNEGGGSAESVVLIDKVPDNTRLTCVNNDSDTTYVNITNGQQGNASGWSVYYFDQATINPSDKTYGATANWSLIGILTAGTETFPGVGTTWTSGEATYDDAYYVKWEKPQVDGGETDKTLTWGVSIK